MRCLGQDGEEGFVGVLDLFGDHHAHEGGGGDVVDGDFGHGADESWVAVEDGDAVAAGAAHELDGAGVVGFVVLLCVSLAGAFDEDVDGLADHFGVVFLADFVLEGEHFVVASAFGFFGDVVGHEAHGLGAGAFGVFEDEAVFEAVFADGVHTELEGLFGFAAEADDEVAGDGASREDFVDAGHHVTVILDGVATFHAFEDFVAAGLEGDVEVVAALGEIAQGLEEIECHVFGVAGDELDAFDAWGVVDHVEEVGEAVLFAVFFDFVAVDGLAKEGDLFDALVGEGDDFLGDDAG